MTERVPATPIQLQQTPISDSILFFPLLRIDSQVLTITRPLVSADVKEMVKSSQISSGSIHSTISDYLLGPFMALLPYPMSLRGLSVAAGADIQIWQLWKMPYSNYYDRTVVKSLSYSVKYSGLNSVQHFTFAYSNFAGSNSAFFNF
jgi:hypothetical protein